MAMVALVAVSMAACGSQARPTLSPTSAPAKVAALTVAPAATAVPTATAVPRTTAAPKATAAAKATAVPQATVAPKATAAPKAALPAKPGESQQQAATLTFSNAQATQLAAQTLASNAKASPVPIKNPRVTFTRQSIKVAADMQGSKVEVLGVPSVKGGRLSFRLTSLKLGGFEVPFYRREVESGVNNVLAGMLAGKRVQSAQLGDGTLTVVTTG
jgi:hypothetical protein